MDDRLQSRSAFSHSQHGPIGVYTPPTPPTVLTSCPPPPPFSSSNELRTPVDWLLRFECQHETTGFMSAAFTLLNALHRRGAFRLVAQAPCDASGTWDLPGFRDEFERGLSCEHRELYHTIRHGLRLPVATGYSLAITKPPANLTLHGRIAIVHGTPCDIDREWRPLDDDNHHAEENAAFWPPAYIVARTMTEGDLNEEEIRCLRHVNELWVPSEWHRQRFTRMISGIPIHVLHDPTDVQFFAPHASIGDDERSATEPFVFLSIFKWEGRKGWDVLLEAYWREFKREEAVTLRIKTYLNFWSGDPPPINLLPPTYDLSSQMAMLAIASHGTRI